MRIHQVVKIIAASVLVMWCASAAVAQSRTPPSGATPEPEAAQLVGIWEVLQTKAPGEAYKSSYRGQSFVSQGPSAFTLVMEYRKDGTFRRVTRVGTTETVQEGTWKLSGHELRHERQAASEEEVMYIRFDAPDEYTSVDVYEGSPDPGLFGRFKRIK